MKKVKCPVCGKTAMKAVNKRKGIVIYRHGKIERSVIGFPMFLVDKECREVKAD